MRLPITSAFVQALCALAVLGCDAGRLPSQLPSGVTVRDSAGVEIVENHTPLRGDEGTLSIDPEPIVQIGCLDCEGAPQFGGIEAALRLGEVGYAVVESPTLEIRIFDTRGAHLRSFGRRGDGPGEFAVAPAVAFAPPDTIMTWDPRTRRQSWFLLSGAVVRERSLGQSSDVGTDFSAARPSWRLAPDGSLLAAAMVRMGTVEEGVPWEAEVDLTVVRGPGAGTAVIRRVPQFRFVSVGGGGVDDAFFAEPHYDFGAAGSSILLSDPGPWTIREHATDGTLTRIIRAGIPRLPITDSLVDVERTVVSAQLGPGPSRELMFEGMSRFTRPDSAPAIGGILSAGSGRAWVGRWPGPRIERVETYDVIDASGRWVSTVTVPEALGRVLRVSDDHVLTEWRDELDVPFLRVYRVRRGAG